MKGERRVVPAPLVPLEPQNRRAAGAGAPAVSVAPAQGIAARERRLGGRTIARAVGLPSTMRRSSELLAGSPTERCGRVWRRKSKRRPCAGWRRLWETMKPAKGPQAPGQERIVSSPVVLGLVAAVMVLVAMGAGLVAIINATAATRAFDQGVQDYDDGDYRTAIRVFDGFLAKNPEDPANRQGTRLEGDGQRAAIRVARGGDLDVGTRGLAGGTRTGREAWRNFATCGPTWGS